MIRRVPRRGKFGKKVKWKVGLNRSRRADRERSWLSRCRIAFIREVMGHHWGLYAGEWHDWICILETIVQREIWRQSQTTVNCGLHAIIQERDCGLELRWLQWEGIGKRGWRDLQKLSSKLFGDWLDIGGQERESLTTPKFPSWETLVGMVVPAYRLRANRMYLSGCTRDSQVRMLVLQWIGGSKGFPVAQLVKNPPAMWETWVPSLGREDPLEEGRATHSSTLA